MRKIAAEARSDALIGLTEEERERFVDILIRVKKNLVSNTFEHRLNPDDVSGKAE